MNKLLHQRKGFTLIEIIVVIAILGILAAVLTPAIKAYYVKAREAKADTEIKRVIRFCKIIITDMDTQNYDFMNVTAEDLNQQLIDQLKSKYNLDIIYQSPNAEAKDDCISIDFDISTFELTVSYYEGTDLFMSDKDDYEYLIRE